MQVVVCKIKDWLKPLVSFLIPGRYRRGWVGDPWNGQALWNISKYQVHTGLDTGPTFENSNFAIGMLLRRQTQRQNEFIYTTLPALK